MIKVTVTAKKSGKVFAIRFADGTVGDPYANVMYHHTYIKIRREA